MADTISKPLHPDVTKPARHKILHDKVTKSDSRSKATMKYKNAMKLEQLAMHLDTMDLNPIKATSPSVPNQTVLISHSVVDKLRETIKLLTEQNKQQGFQLETLTNQLNHALDREKKASKTLTTQSMKFEHEIEALNQQILDLKKQIVRSQINETAAKNEQTRQLELDYYKERLLTKKLSESLAEANLDKENMETKLNELLARHVEIVQTIKSAQMTKMKENQKLKDLISMLSPDSVASRYLKQLVGKH